MKQCKACSAPVASSCVHQAYVYCAARFYSVLYFYYRRYYDVEWTMQGHLKQTACV